MSSPTGRELTIYLYLFSIIAVFPFLTSASSSLKFDLFGNMYRVHVINGFSSNDLPFLLHCWSSNDDLGHHSLYIGGDFNFHFGLRIIPPSTRFWCDMNRGPKYIPQVSVFEEDEVLHLCSHTQQCYWRGQDNGLYFCNDNSSYFKLYDWYIRKKER
ncbi:SPH1 [Turnera subulata]|uniref:S-protein homolog n=8 Tax=Turnera TaxID=45183 RepID=A0A1X9H9W9_9ROSI|nr:sph1 protein [Turnera subulata]QDP16900.1 SPH1 [Turnera subulata]